MEIDIKVILGKEILMDLEYSIILMEKNIQVNIPMEEETDMELNIQKII